MPKRIIAVAASDLHIHNWKPFNHNNMRLSHSLDQLRLISKYCKKYGVPALFTGDLFHDPSGIGNALNTSAKAMYKTYFEQRGINFIGISGNHDMSQVNYYDNRSPSHLRAFDVVFDTFKLIDFSSYELNKDTEVWGIPYINHNRDYPEILSDIRSKFSKPHNILLVHTDLPGALETNGEEVKTAHNIDPKMNKTFKGFDLVLSGHIHKPQQLAKNVFMLGAMQQHSRKDRNCEMGIWLVREDFTMKFIPINSYPKFMLYSGNELPDNFNYYDKVEEAPQEEEEANMDIASLDSRKTLIKSWAKTKPKELTKARKNLLLSLISQV